ncbi:hypothetical protein A7E78_02785 [Syntrophotalea acetylenivorans]|uniref:DUF3108 domain-containing protein n=1 Tax=Syntrophotalea acetylenivorans TaxID=1842532 RepID=A0A1L3GMF3_9BACT|nr:DUF3108 domain-containing protein [Syntrophotalea acetylenivorans]APG26858.1 hypothetical protein A7E78_02785 [Syntrophotalea acetylenivorans]
MRFIWKHLFIVFGLSFLLFASAEGQDLATTVDPDEKREPVHPAVEQYRYDIAFLWFDRLAEAQLSLQPVEEPNRWQATLEANTLGVAAWLTSDRAQSYVSLMQLDKEEGFTSLRHDSNISKTKEGRKRVRLKRYLFDHKQQKIIQRVTRNGRQKEDLVLPMPPVKPNDILTAFYNFRQGVYGPLVKGAKYRIPTYSRMVASEIIVEVLADKQRPRSPKFPKQGLLLKVQIDKEVFDTDNGIVYVWLDAQGRPAQVVVEDVIGMGDVRCTLQQKGQSS